MIWGNRLLQLSLLLLLAADHVRSQMGPRDGKPKPKAQPLKADLPYIGCGVCEAVVEELYAGHARKLEELPKHVKKVPEIEIVDLLSKTCKEESKEGEWIRKIDIFERKDSKGHKYLDLVKPGGTAKCGPECATISHSCYQLLEEEIDSDQLSGLLWKATTPLEDAKAKVCKKWTKRCSKPQRPLSGKAGMGRKDFPFEEQSEKDLQMEQMMASMRDSGMGGMSMYSRDELEGMGGGGGEDEYGEDGADGYGGGGGMGGLGGGMGGGYGSGEDEGAFSSGAKSNGFEF